MLRIDIDGIYHTPRLSLQIALYSMPRPFLVRLSSSREGLHLAVPACAEWDYRRFSYDDPMRIRLDEQRVRARLPVKNLLWDIKNGKTASEWNTIKTERDIERFLDAIETLIIYSQRAYRYLCTLVRDDAIFSTSCMAERITGWDLK